MTTSITALAGLGTFFLASLLTVPPQPAPAPTPAPGDEVAGVDLPRTAEDHMAAADGYTRRAAELRKEADLHRRMVAAYERLARDLASQPAPPPKRGKTFPSRKSAKSSKDPAAEYRAHCMTYTGGAEMLADEADTLAEIHRAQAHELRETKHP